MHIRCGFTMSYECAAATTMLLALSTHPTRDADLLTPAPLRFNPDVAPEPYLDEFGNRRHRICAPKGTLDISTEFLIRDSGSPDPVAPGATQFPIEALPAECLVYLLASRYCETDKLSEIAWSLFGDTRPGWDRVQAICDFVHRRVRFGYEYSRTDKSAYDVFAEGRGVCRDFTHLAITLCRSMNIPARYCTGYLGDIAVPPAPYPMDFSAWFEVYLGDSAGGRWYAFDPRHNVPRVGRILMATGRDATDVPLSLTFGMARLMSFEVVTKEVATLQPTVEYAYG